jgi:hypothetical protein
MRNWTFVGGMLFNKLWGVSTYLADGPWQHRINYALPSVINVLFRRMRPYQTKLKGGVYDIVDVYIRHVRS